MSYKLKYNFLAKSGNYEKKDADTSKNEGLADKIVFISILDNEEGCNILPLSFDGNTGFQMDDLDLFKIWSMWSNAFIDADIPEEYKNIAKTAFEAMRDIILNRRVKQ